MGRIDEHKLQGDELIAQGNALFFHRFDLRFERGDPFFKVHRYTSFPGVLIIGTHGNKDN